MSVKEISQRRTPVVRASEDLLSITTTVVAVALVRVTLAAQSGSPHAAIPAITVSMRS